MCLRDAESPGQPLTPPLTGARPPSGRSAPGEKEEALLLDLDADPRACRTARGNPHILDENSHSGCSPVSARSCPETPHTSTLPILTAVLRRTLSFGRCRKQKRGAGRPGAPRAQCAELDSRHRQSVFSASSPFLCPRSCPDSRPRQHQGPLV